MHDRNGAYVFKFAICRGSVSGRSTRQSTQLNIPFLKTASGHRTFYFRIVKLWNDLCPELKLSMTIRDFKRKLKRFLFEQFLLECMQEYCILALGFTIYLIHILLLIR